MLFWRGKAMTKMMFFRKSLWYLRVAPIRQHKKSGLMAALSVNDFFKVRVLEL